ncbi:FecR family protein [Thermophagus sp. OGC60D27]|uniref:FecR family protein n=1 Tax=Thermophagus sp. OGC60D27 TaxID=3458415 RepID=UPI0040383658
MSKDSQIEKQLQRILSIRKEQDVDAQISEAEQIIHSIEKVNSYRAFELVRKRIEKANSRIRVLDVLMRAAAILFIPLLITSVILFSKQKVQPGAEQFAEQKISNPLGVRSEISLPDGTVVWLNAESTISYKVPFVGGKQREVKLIGEAFFKVKKNDQLPFRVESGDVSVTVLGTQFNCKAFPEDSTIEVVLAEGSIKLNPMASNTAIKGVIMKPGERAVVDKMSKETIISTENIEKYIGWHKNKLILDECPMPEIAQRLERWFGVEVEIVDPKVEDVKISSTFENESLSEILEMLEIASPIKVEQISAKMEGTTDTLRRRKVLISRADR